MLSLFYVEALPTGNKFTITGDNAHHAITVLRAKKNEIVRISDGLGNYCDLSLDEIGKREIECSVLNRGSSPAKNQQIKVVQALPKSDRTKEMIELLVESGVDQIYPWQATRSIGKLAPDWREKWEQNSRAAAAQCKRNFLPKVDQLFSGDWSEFQNPQTLLLLFHESGREKLSDWVEREGSLKIPSIQNVVAVIGPEGGLTEEELAAGQAAGGIVLRLGDEVYRSAHAGIAIASALNLLLKRY